jgi:signal transduction histidine kinase
MSARSRGRSLRTRLLVFVGVVLVGVCLAMALTTVLVQRAYLLGELDQRVANAAENTQDAVGTGPGIDTDPGFLTRQGQAVGTLAARLDDDGDIVAAEVLTRDGGSQALTAPQRAPLAGTEADGSLHTRTLPGLGTYRVSAFDADGSLVLTGLPMGEVQDMIRNLIAVEAGVTGAGLVAAGGVCAVFVRRQLRPLGRMAATAAEVSRATAAQVSRSRLGHNEAIALTRVPEHDTAPGSEVGQVGAALNGLIDVVESSITERRRSEEQVRHSEERMRRFLADASHELRTPLASIAGYAELMNRGTGPIEPVLAWHRVSAESARMTGLVEDLLLLARLDEGRPLQYAEVDLAALVAEAVWDARTAGGGHDWQLELSLDAPALVAGDAARLRQVLANLLANARMHTPVGTKVVASVEATAARCVVRVRDDGPGIPPALLPGVFERFTRADPSRSRTDARAGGSGLGLAIAAAITSAHGGRIDVHSVPGCTEFTVDLPAADEPAGVRAARSRSASV